MLWQLFWSFFKIGAVTFGSGYAMVPVVEKEVVERRKWMTRDDFYDQFALAQSSPGPVVINTAVFVGYDRRGWVGSLVAAFGCALPSFLIILALALVIGRFRDNRYVSAAFKGLMPAVVALIAVPFVKMLKPLPWYKILVGVAVAAALWLTGISPVWAVVAGLSAGLVQVFVDKFRSLRK